VAGFFCHAVQNIPFYLFATFPFEFVIRGNQLPLKIFEWSQNMGYVPEDELPGEIQPERWKGHGHKSKKKDGKHQPRRHDEDEWGNDWDDTD
jgi:hypothetical protein